MDGHDIYNNLSPRQRQIMLLLITGQFSNQHIADRLNLKVRVIANHFTKILDICGVESRVELMLFTMKTPKLEDLLISNSRQILNYHSHSHLESKSLEIIRPRRLTK